MSALEGLMMSKLLGQDKKAPAVKRRRKSTGKKTKAKKKGVSAKSKARWRRDLHARCTHARSVGRKTINDCLYKTDMSVANVQALVNCLSGGASEALGHAAGIVSAGATEGYIPGATDVPHGP